MGGLGAGEDVYIFFCFLPKFEDVDSGIHGWLGLGPGALGALMVV